MFNFSLIASKEVFYLAFFLLRRYFSPPNRLHCLPDTRSFLDCRISSKYFASAAIFVLGSQWLDLWRGALNRSLIDHRWPFRNEVCPKLSEKVYFNFGRLFAEKLSTKRMLHQKCNDGSFNGPFRPLFLYFCLFCSLQLFDTFENLAAFRIRTTDILCRKLPLCHLRLN